jgi:hypothetical protein
MRGDGVAGHRYGVRQGAFTNRFLQRVANHRFTGRPVHATAAVAVIDYNPLEDVQPIQSRPPLPQSSADQWNKAHWNIEHGQETTVAQCPPNGAPCCCWRWGIENGELLAMGLWFSA